MGRPVKVLSERAQWLTCDDGIQVLVTLHPSAPLRSLDDREAVYAAWLDDLRKANRIMRAARKATG